MKPTTTVAETTAPDGAVFKLLKHDGEFYLYMNERQVMSTAMTHSERLLADIGCAFSRSRPNARVLIGGLGLGFSLRRTLELTGPDAHAINAELLPEIVRWNHELLDGLNDDILTDSRAEIVMEDVHTLIETAAHQGPKFDVILLDVDDGPSSRLQPQNARLYGSQGLQRLKDALTEGGRLAIWAAAAEPKLLASLQKAGFRTRETPCAKHERAKSKRHRIYLAEKRGPTRPSASPGPSRGPLSKARRPRRRKDFD